MGDYAGVDNWPTTIPIIDDGDEPKAAELAPADEGNRDALVYLYNRTAIGSIDHREVSMQSDYVDKFAKSFSGAPMGFGWLQTDVTGVGYVWLEFGHDLKYYEFQSVLAYVRGAGHVSLPNTMPNISVWKWANPSADSEPTRITLQGGGLSSSDTSLSVPSYDAPHFILAPLQANEVINRKVGAPNRYARYFIRFEGEFQGGASANSLMLKSCRIAPGLFG